MNKCLAYTADRSKFWDKVWLKYNNRTGFGSYYHKRLAKVYRFLIPKKSSVLEIGCGNGKLLASLNCKSKTGIDFSEEAIKIAIETYPNCQFIHTGIQEFNSTSTFDYIILSDLLGDLWDVQIVGRTVAPDSKIKIEKTHERTKLAYKIRCKRIDESFRF